MLNCFFKLWENCYLIILPIHILKLEISGCDKIWLDVWYMYVFVNIYVWKVVKNGLWKAFKIVREICVKIWIWKDVKDLI
jgi:hypothetical protein